MFLMVKKGRRLLKKIISALSLKLSVSEKEILWRIQRSYWCFDYKKIIGKIPQLIKNLSNTPESWLKAMRLELLILFQNYILKK